MIKYTMEQLESIAEKLREMPAIEKKKQEHSKQDAIRVLSKEITSLQKRGYTLEQISETLRGEGLSIAIPTLKSYLQRAKTAKNPRKSTMKKQKEIPHVLPHSEEIPHTPQATFTPRPDDDDI